MGELTIRRNKGFAVPPRPATVSRSGKSTSTAAAQKTADTGITVSKSLRQLMERVTDLTPETRRALQTGEGTLEEVQEKLEQMADLAEEAETEDSPDLDALQKQLDQLAKEIDRILSRAMIGETALFLNTDTAAGTDALPGWLTGALVLGNMDADRILSALGLDKNAAGTDILAALVGRTPENDPVAGYLATLYLGAAIAKGSGDLDPSAALEGIRRLLETVASGKSVDEAVQLLTNGEYTSLADFQEQFADGTATGLREFLESLLLSDPSIELFPDSLMNLMNGLSGLDGMTLLSMMADSGTMELDLLAALMSAGEAHTSGLTADPAQTLTPSETAPETANSAPTETAATARTNNTQQPVEVKQYGDFQVQGRDLSGVSYDASTGGLTVGGTADVIVRGIHIVQGQENQQTVLHIAGTGTVTIQDVKTDVLTVDAPQAKIATAGTSFVGEVRLGDDTTLTLDGRGFLHAGTFTGGTHARLQLTGGAVALAAKADGTPGTLTIPTVIDGPVSLYAQATHVQDASGKTLEPFDIVWKTLLPGFASVSSMELAGKQARMLLQGGANPDLARLWLSRSDFTQHGFPTYSLVFRGRDEAGHGRTRYAYLYWTRSGEIKEKSQYPNPFRVTGGEQDRDWYYEEESHTLHILSNQVTAISGGAGTNIWKEPFSGRISLLDNIGALNLALGGVTCRVTSGRAFQLGRENDVTLVLRAGSVNHFESGDGYAGISLGSGTSLRIDCMPPASQKETAGTLTASGGAGRAGIGQDGGTGEIGHIMIRGGTVTSTEKPDAAGSVTIVGSAGTGINSDLGSAKTWARMGLFLQMGDGAVILPQYSLSSRSLQLNKLRVSTREYAHAARMTIDTDRRWVSRIQTAYNSLSNHLEQSSLDPQNRVRDTTSAGVLLREISRSAPILSDRAMQARSLKSLEDVNRLLK